MSAIRAAAKSLFAAADIVRRSPPGPRVLIYHQVGTNHGHQMEVTLDDFQRQVDWLIAEREVVDLDTAVARWSEPNADQLAVLTFDDGYSDVFTTAFPILEDREVPFVLYVSTSLIADDAATGDGALTWSDLEKMLASGLMTLGAHTAGHPDLRSLRAEEVEEELSTSDDVLHRRLGLRPRHFAYPYGFWSESADGAVRRRYDTAVLGGSPRPDVAPDPHLIHRYPVQLSDGFTFFKRRMSGGFWLEETLRRRLKGYAGP
jgi:peptidoglycan/xylan/chitin deacetylase (PgdA/CDA1 family)